MSNTNVWAPKGFKYDKKGNLIAVGPIDSFDVDNPDNNFAPKGFTYDKTGNLVRNQKKAVKTNSKITMKKATAKPKRKKRSMSLKQAKALSKGQRIQKEAMKLMKAAGQRTVSKKVYNMTLGEAMKKAARKAG